MRKTCIGLGQWIAYYRSDIQILKYWTAGLFFCVHSEILDAPPKNYGK